MMKPSTASRKFWLSRNACGLTPASRTARRTPSWLATTWDIMMMISVSGMLRMTLTNPPAKPRISGTGLTRIATRMTPRMNDPIADQKVS